MSKPRLALQPQAIAMYQRALDANAGYDEIYFNRATLYMQMSLYEKAIADYRTCLAINPMSHEAYNALATIYVKDPDALYRPVRRRCITRAWRYSPKIKTCGIIWGICTRRKINGIRPTWPTERPSRSTPNSIWPGATCGSWPNHSKGHEKDTGSQARRDLSRNLMTS